MASIVSPRRYNIPTSRINRTEKKNRILHVGSYEIGKTLGHGSFGKVKLGINVFTKEKVAIKFIKHTKLAAKREKESSEKEIAIMKLLSHKNIVQLIDVINKPEDGFTFIIVEYVPGGELFDYIVAQEYIKEKEARRFFRQIVSAIEYCHANLIVHRDLKPENLLLDQNNEIKISDFGLSNVLEPGILMDSFCGSPLYAAPEILLAEKYVGPPVDIWSLGVILYALLCGSLPWEGETQAEISHNCVTGTYQEPDILSEPVKDLLRRMLTVNPLERASIEEVRNHPWTNEGYDELPPSMLDIKDPVCEIRDDIIEQMVALGFKVQDNEELRNRILDNEPCQATAIYHLLLDRVVQDEMEQLKQQFAQNPGKIQHRGSIPEPEIDDETLEDASPRSYSEEESLPSPVPMEKSEISPTPSFTFSKPKIDTHKAAEKAGIIETRPRSGSETGPRRVVLAGPANAIVSPRKMAAIMEDEEAESSPALEKNKKPHSDTTVPYSSPSQKPTPNETQVAFSTIPQHSAHIMSYSSPSAITPNALSPALPLPITSKLPPRPSLSREQSPRSIIINANATQPSPRNILTPPAPTNQSRRRSICGPPTNLPQQRVSPPKKPPSQLRASSVLPAPSSNVSGRRFSLDARVAAASQTSPRGRYEDTSSSMGVPRAVRGIFKSSTTTTKPPEQAAKIVKKTLEGGGFFTKKRSPYLFQVIDDQTNVTFEVEVCFISPLQMTGIHLKRISGDVWKYKTIATDLVNHMNL